MLTAYTIYFYRMWDIANAIMALPKQTIKATVSLNRINEILNQESGHELTGSPTVLPSLKVIRLNDIGYVIDGKTIFSHFSGYISYEKGKIIGITGENGSGKSTLARLINKSIIPTSGSLYYNDIPYDKIPEQSIKEKILVVPAESCIFEGTIRQNIFFFQEGELTEKIKELLQMVGLNENNYIKEKGNNISNGQKKVIEICRSMISDQEVIIYDEPTNFIDRNIKKILTDTIQELSFNKTIIVITHDSDMIKNCSHIIDLSDFH